MNKNGRTDEQQRAIDAFTSKVEATMERNGGARQAAVREVCHKHPELHRAFLVATNQPGAAIA